jgi:hypothetical protein
VCGISSRRVASEMALLGAATSCVNVLVMPISMQAAMQETNVIRYCTFTGYELLCMSIYS